MRRQGIIVGSVVAVVGALLGTAPASGDRPSARDRVRPGGFEVYTATVDAAGLQVLGDAGVDREHAVRRPEAGALADVEVVLTPQQARSVRARGVDLQVKEVDGQPASRVMAEQAEAGYTVFHPYSGPGGIVEELRDTVAAHPGLTKLVRAGRSGTGQTIWAVKVTRGAARTPDGSKPAVLYGAAQHAREWITPQMVTRLMHHVIDGYGRDPRLTRLLDTRELWFLPVQNPDGYDYTFTEGGRLWRKTLRDNDGDGQVTPADGVDMNRNFPYRWGFDNEGSDPTPSGETYRGPSPASEPETRATIDLVRRVDFRFFVNYHSAAELLLYGVGWQVDTPSPDDEIYRPLVGDDADPAVPGYDPDISAELYTTNGDTDGDAHERLGTLTVTPEMSTCETASAIDPDDAFDPADCASGFSFPDDETLVEDEYEKNVPFALSLADSAADPDDPRSVVGETADPLVPDAFPSSYGTRQTVAVTAKRALRGLRMTYRINGRPAIRGPVHEWRGGQRYGGENDVYYAEYRAVVRGQRRGDRVEVTFSGVEPGRGRVSESFRYRVARDLGGDVLVLAAEDYTGLSPVQDAGPTTVGAYVSALTRAGYSSDVYDVDAAGRTAPHPLGVLSHYRAVVWETGEDVIPRNQDQVAGTAARWTHDTELAVRDYLNEGGKVVVAGKYGLYAQAADGGYWYQPDEATAGSCTTPEEYPCLPLGNDFLQYWLGAYQYVDDGGTSEAGPFPLVGEDGTPYAGLDVQLDASQDHTGAWVSTSSFLPVEEFPQFASTAPLAWQRGIGDPFSPYTGDWFMSAGSASETYQRLSRTVDLTAATSGRLDLRISAQTEPDWDYVFVEARPVGTDDWTTLPDLNGHTSSDTGDSCPEGWAELHPQLLDYQTPTADGCDPTGVTGEWNAFTGNSSGWQDWSLDLSSYAGQQVEVAVAYVTDWSTTGLGVWVDDARVTIDGAPADETSFETDLGGWAVPGSPPGSAANAIDWTRSQQTVDEGAAVTTDRSALFGFGLEGLSPADRALLLRRSLTSLVGPG